MKLLMDVPDNIVIMNIKYTVMIKGKYILITKIYTTKEVEDMKLFNIGKKITDATATLDCGINQSGHTQFEE